MKHIHYFAILFTLSLLQPARADGPGSAMEFFTTLNENWVGSLTMSNGHTYHGVRLRVRSKQSLPWIRVTSDTLVPAHDAPWKRGERNHWINTDHIVSLEVRVRKPAKNDAKAKGAEDSSKPD